MREAASSLRSFVLPSPNGRGAAELLPNPPRPQFLAAIPNSLGQISADGPPSNTFLDQTLQSLEQVPLPGESPLPGPRAGIICKPNCNRESLANVSLRATRQLTAVYMHQRLLSFLAMEVLD